MAIDYASAVNTRVRVTFCRGAAVVDTQTRRAVRRAAAAAVELERKRCAVVDGRSLSSNGDERCSNVLENFRPELTNEKRSWHVV